MNSSPAMPQGLPLQSRPMSTSTTMVMPTSTSTARAPTPHGGGNDLVPVLLYRQKNQDRAAFWSSDNSIFIILEPFVVQCISVLHIAVLDANARFSHYPRRTTGDATPIGDCTDMLGANTDTQVLKSRF